MKNSKNKCNFKYDTHENFNSDDARCQMKLKIKI